MECYKRLVARNDICTLLGSQPGWYPGNFLLEIYRRPLFEIVVYRRLVTPPHISSILEVIYTLYITPNQSATDHFRWRQVNIPNNFLYCGYIYRTVCRSCSRGAPDHSDERAGPEALAEVISSDQKETTIVKLNTFNTQNKKPKKAEAKAAPPGKCTRRGYCSSTDDTNHGQWWRCQHSWVYRPTWMQHVCSSTLPGWWVHESRHQSHPSEDS